MSFYANQGPIIACSTSTATHAALGVIRISGFRELSSFNDFFSIDLHGPIEPRKVYYCKLVLQGQVLDEVCLTFFKAPHSFTGENTLEISAHGNTLNLQRIMNTFIQHGLCILAQPGEFSYRALKNKKLTLSQIEGLDLLLNANSHYALNEGLSLINGELHHSYVELYDLFLILKSSLELMIDFSEDVGLDESKLLLKQSTQNLYLKLSQLNKRIDPLSAHLIHPEIVIAGLPNAGKSSFFNVLLSQNRAIVSSIPGTTRDFVSESFFVDGIQFRVTDTAGLRTTSDQIEHEGIIRAKKKIKGSFFSILVVNPFDVFQANDQDSMSLTPYFEELTLESFDFYLLTHNDLPGFDNLSKRLKEKLNGPIGTANLLTEDEELIKNIERQILDKYKLFTSRHPLLLDRHSDLIKNSFQLISNFKDLIENEDDLAILSHELNSLGHCFSELLGIITPDKVLNSIFSNFCIGK